MYAETFSKSPLLCWRVYFIRFTHRWIHCASVQWFYWALKKDLDRKPNHVQAPRPHGHCSCRSRCWWSRQMSWWCWIHMQWCSSQNLGCATLRYVTLRTGNTLAILLLYTVGSWLIPLINYSSSTKKRHWVYWVGNGHHHYGLRLPKMPQGITERQTTPRIQRWYSVYLSITVHHLKVRQLQEAECSSHLGNPFQLVLIPSDIAAQVFQMILNGPDRRGEIES